MLLTSLCSPYLGRRTYAARAWGFRVGFTAWVRSSLPHAALVTSHINPLTHQAWRLVALDALDALEWRRVALDGWADFCGKKAPLVRRTALPKIPAVGLELTQQSAIVSKASRDQVVHLAVGLPVAVDGE